MRLDDLESFAITPALMRLPQKMDSEPARVMLIAIALQESGAQHRHQIGGPAHGYWQFEKGGGVAGVLQHRATKDYVREVCSELDIAPETTACYDAIQHNDVLAAVFARLLLWTLPQALPATAAEGWDQYIAAWRPGKPHPEPWSAHYVTAWNQVHGDAPVSAQA